MKRLFLSIAILAFGLAASAQDKDELHLSIGLEAGTTGAGIQFAMPVIPGHLVVTAGINSIPASLSGDYEVPEDLVSEVNNYVGLANVALTVASHPDKFKALPEESSVGLSVAPDFNTAKVMVEYYPFKKASFHITAGAYAAQRASLLSAEFNISDFWETYSYDKGMASDPALAPYLASVPVSLPETGISVNGKSYELTGPDVQLAIGASRIRPYLGIGFGRSIPKRHLGFQMDLGAWYHGTPYFKVGGDLHEVEFNEDYPGIDISEAAGEDINLKELGEKIVFWPQLSFRIIYKIF